MEDIEIEEDKYKIFSTTQFKKEYKKYLNNEKKILKIDATIALLKKGGIENIPQHMRPHPLTGNYNRHLECHIESDLLIIWIQYDEEEKKIILTRLGSHSELFKK